MYLSTDRSGRVAVHDTEQDARNSASEKGGRAFNVSASELEPEHRKVTLKNLEKARYAPAPPQ